MGKVLSAVRTKVGLVAIGGALLVAGIGGTAVAVSSPGTEPVSDESAVTAPATTPASTAPTSTGGQPVAPAQDQVDEAVVPAQVATVDDVTTQDDVQPAPVTIPAPQVNPDGSLPEGWLPPQNPGEPPVAPDPGLPPVDPLEGETGYQPAG